MSRKAFIAKDFLLLLSYPSSPKIEIWSSRANLRKQAEYSENWQETFMKLSPNEGTCCSFTVFRASLNQSDLGACFIKTGVVVYHD